MTRSKHTISSPTKMKEKEKSDMTSPYNKATEQCIYWDYEPKDCCTGCDGYPKQKMVGIKKGARTTFKLEPICPHYTTIDDQINMSEG